MNRRSQFSYCGTQDLNPINSAPKVNFYLIKHSHECNLNTVANCFTLHVFLQIFPSQLCVFTPLVATCSEWEPASSSKWTDPETETNVRGEETETRSPCKYITTRLWGFRPAPPWNHSTVTSLLLASEWIEMEGVPGCAQSRPGELGSG